MTPVLQRLTTGPLPDVLYHYTNSNGLLGILTSNRLWASSALYLNDSSEYTFGLNLIRDALEKRLRLIDDEHEKAYLDNTLRNLSAKFFGICVASLTEKGDLLSQWRGYAGGTGGFSLGLHPKRVRSIAGDQGFYLTNCLYSESDQQAAICELLDDLCKRAKPELANSSCASGSALADRVALRLKHKSFKEEQEWRLFSMPHGAFELEFRPGVSSLVPYFPFDLKQDRDAYLHSVTVGPTPNLELAKLSVQMLLKRLNVANADEKVFTTCIPYRNW